VPSGLHSPWRLIIRRFELSDKTYSRTNFEPATRVAVRRASGLVLVGQPEVGRGVSINESLDVTLAYLKGKDAESEEAQEHAKSSSLALYA